MMIVCLFVAMGQNILIYSASGGEYNLKLGDFGLGKEFTSEEQMGRTMAGTPDYMGL
jgi:serine/threonine protein kinase